MYEWPTTRVIKKGEEIAMCTAVTSILSQASTGYLMDQLLSDERLEKGQEKLARNLINDFQDIFSTSSKDVGRTILAQHRIDTGTQAAIKQRPRKIPFAKQEEVGKLICEMKDNGIIEPSSSS